MSKWSFGQRAEPSRRRPWHRDPGYLAETLNRVPIAIGGVLAIVAVAAFLVWLGGSAVMEAWRDSDWGLVAWRLVEATLGVVFCALVGFLVGKALTTLFLRLSLRLADSRAIRSLEHRWEGWRTQPTERRY